VNFAGQTIETGKLTAQNQQIQVSELPAGIYLLQLNAGNQQLTRKFVVER
jgi:Fe2+ transport system protein B